MSSNPRIGLYVIGDEILSGKRQDKHLAKVIELLGMRGLQLSWARYLGDDRDALARSFAETFAGDDIVFSCGGIGATPDDHTRQAAAQALGRPLELHPEARAAILERIREAAAAGQMPADPDHPENRQRMRMGEFPAGAAIIPNPYNRIPGFSVGLHWFVPGFPVMAWPMIEWVLDTQYAHLAGGEVPVDRSLIVWSVNESTLTPLMEAVEREFADVKVYSLPSVGDATRRRHIELGVKGPAARVELAYARLVAGVAALGIEHEPR